MQGIEARRCVGSALRVIGLAASCAAALLGCGGGQGGSGSAAPGGSVGGAAAVDSAENIGIALDPPQTVGSSSRIQLTWRTQGDARSFNVFVQRSADQAFEVVDAHVAGNSAQVARGAAWKLDFPTARVRVQACSAAQQCVDSNEQPLEAVLLAGTAQLQFADPTQFVRFGRAVALSGDGNTLAVSARDASLMEVPEGSGRTDVGSVTMFHRGSDGAWQRASLLTRQGLDPFEFGLVLALSGDGRTLAVGVPLDLTGPAASAIDGGVHVYTRDAQDQWSRQAVVRAVGSNPDFSFGRRVALSHDGNRMVAGAFVQSFVFDRTGGQWQQSAEFNIQGPLAISANGGTIGIGSAPSEYNPFDVPGAIPVFVFERCSCGAGWHRVADLRTPRVPTDASGFVLDGFGADIAFTGDGKTVAIGAPADSLVYVFGAAAAGWTRSDTLSALASDDRMGLHVAISLDGEVIAASARGLAANTPGLRRNHRAGDSSTAIDLSEVNVAGIYFFERASANTWRRSAAALLSTVQLSMFSDAVALSADGLTYAAGVMPVKGTGEFERAAVY